MNLLEVLTLIETSVTLDVDNVREKFDSKNEIPFDRLSYVVRLMKPDNNDILITLMNLKSISPWKNWAIVLK